jgi:predicted RND superfamily exporter protein
MTRALHLFARLAVRVPAATLAAIVLVTFLLGAAASRLEVDTSLDTFAPPGGAADALSEVERRFGSGATLQIVVDTGPGGDVLTRDVLVAVDTLVRTIETDPVIAPALAEPTAARPTIVGFATPFLDAVDIAGEPIGEVQPFVLDVLRDEVLDAAGGRISGLFSDDLDLATGRARAGLLLVNLDSTAPRAERDAAVRRIAEVVDTTEVDGARRGVIAFTLIEDAIQDALARDVPVLLSLSLLLVVIVLAFLFRSVLDVSVGLVGLLASIVWMIGAAALLGPQVLDWIGPFNQVSIAVPVLLVGLGIDYSVHLTSRYREERARGARAEAAATTAMTTVGVALVLATVASVAGFLANLVTPLPPIRDFGIFAAIGIVAAFFVLAGGVLASRTLVDRRRDRRADRAAAAAPASSAAQTTRPTPAATSGTPAAHQAPAWARALTTLAVRHARLALVGTAVILTLGAISAANLSTEFDERDFLPDGEPVLLTLDRLEDLFGGDVSERTLVLVDGDLDDPALHAAVAAFIDALPTLPDVRLSDGRVEVASWLSLRDSLVEEGEGVRERLAADLAAWDDPVAAVADLRLPTPAELDGLGDGLGDDLDTTVDLPDELRELLLARLPDGLSPVAALAAAADPDTFARDLRERLAADLAAERPEGLSDAALTTLVALDESALTLAALADVAAPEGLLDPEDRERLARLEAIEAAGPSGSTDGTVLVAHLAVLRAEVPRDLASDVDGSGLLLGVPTTGGQDRAREVVADLAALAAPIEAAGGTVTVVSDALVLVDIIDQLAGSQLSAIAISLTAAAVLLVVSSLVSAGVVGLGLIGIVPSLVALVMVLGLMQLLGVPFNALTATVASIAVGIGVPYGIHLINRFREALERGESADAAIAETLEHTGPALIGSALTTGLAFAVLQLSSSTPIQQFGSVSTMMIVFAVLGCLLVQPSALVLWGRRYERRRSSRRGTAGDASPVLVGTA